MDGIEEVRARNRQRYHDRIARQYEAFKQHKCAEGTRRYHAMSAEKQEEVKRKNLVLQKVWIGEAQVRGLIDRRKIRGGPPMGTRFPPPLHPWTESGDWRIGR